jgi:hypothetical protein
MDNTINKSGILTQIANFPTEFRGCTWNDGWEFGNPAVIYYPKQYRCYGETNLDQVVEDICISLAIGQKLSDGGLAKECEWRGWGPRFDRRRDAWHVLYKVRWFVKDGEIIWDITDAVAVSKNKYDLSIGPPA